MGGGEGHAEGEESEKGCPRDGTSVPGWQKRCSGGHDGGGGCGKTYKAMVAIHFPSTVWVLAFFSWTKMARVTMMKPQYSMP